MQKSMRLCDFHYPYAILISKFLHYFEVDIEGELAEVIKPSSEINSGSLSKMGFTKIGGRWVSKDHDQAGPSGTNEGDESEDAATQDGPTTEDQEADHNDAYMGERMTTMSPFERLMMNRMDTFAENQDSIIWSHVSQLWMNKLKKFRIRLWNSNLKGRAILLFSLLL